MIETNLTAGDKAPILRFPTGFLWGASTSPFQVEGNVRNSDWWRWEQTAQPPERRSELAADHYHRFRQDFDLAQSLGHNAHRLGIEWSRIEPRPGEFDLDEITHYQEVLRALKERDMQVILTLHHFTNPAWIADLGGWENFQTPDYFTRFVKHLVPKLGENVDLWLTINEPTVYTKLGFVDGLFPPQKKDFVAYFKAYWNMAKAHKKAYHAIHDEDPKAQVGMANAMTAFSNYHKGPLGDIEDRSTKMLDFFNNQLFYSLTGKTHDFLGLNYYMGFALRLNFGLPRMQFLGEEKSDVGWGIYPQGLFKILNDSKKYNLPIYITENGIATRQDDIRKRFLISHLAEVHRAILSGADIRGYFHWSLLDNMELHLGYDPKFGLIEVDFNTQIRTPKPSAYVYKEIIENNGIPLELLQ